LRTRIVAPIIRTLVGKCARLGQVECGGRDF
jgi:hypothetical protein